MWERVKWLVITALKFKRTAYPRTKWGVNLCLAALMSGMFSIGVLNVQFKSDFIINTLGLIGQEPSLYSMYLSVFLIGLGSMLIYSEWNLKLRHTANVLISSMPGLSVDFPHEVLDPTEKAFCREPMVLGISQTGTENIEQQIKRYNAELEVDLFKRHILHEKGQRLYIGGLARIPFLVSYGAMLRNVSAEIIYFDKFHRNGQYSLLAEENEQVSLSTIPLVTAVNSTGDIGLAIGFTTPINTSQIPSDLQDATTIIYPTIENDRNLIKNQENLHEISAQIGKIIDTLSALPDCKRVHLFLSVQSALAIELGRRYQEGTHKNWVIHNFDPSTNSYNWAIKLSKSGIADYRNFEHANTDPNIVSV